MEGCGRFWEVVGGCGRWWEVVGGGGRWWEVVGGGGRWWEVVEVLKKCPLTKGAKIVAKEKKLKN